MKKIVLIIFAVLLATPATGQTVFDGKWRKRVETERNIIDGSIRAIAVADIKAQEFFRHQSGSPGMHFSLSYVCRSEHGDTPLMQYFAVYAGELLSNTIGQDVNVRWGDEPGKEFIREPGAVDKAFSFLDTDSMMDKMLTHDNFLIEVPLYRRSPIYLNIELENAKEAIEKAKDICLD